MPSELVSDEIIFMEWLLDRTVLTFLGRAYGHVGFGIGSVGEHAESLLPRFKVLSGGVSTAMGNTFCCSHPVGSISCDSREFQFLN